jgi:hypothetical protein
MTKGHSCTKLQIDWSKCRGVQTSYSGRGKSDPWGKAPTATISGGLFPAKQPSWGRHQIVKPQQVNNLSLAEVVDALPGKFVDAGTSLSTTEMSVRLYKTKQHNVSYKSGKFSSTIIYVLSRR